MRASNVCEHPDHQGDRLVNRLDLLEVRTEWRRLSDQGREHVRIQSRVCKTCARADIGNVIPAGQGTLS